jgi:hypothetical protein
MICNFIPLHSSSWLTEARHGQWDYGNRWAVPGCSEGNCLRDHVDLMETYSALTMITKAGVPSHKVTVGIANCKLRQTIQNDRPELRR